MLYGRQFTKGLPKTELSDYKRPWSTVGYGRDPLSQNFRKFRYRIKWNGIFRKLCFENSCQPLEVVLFSKNLEIPEIFCSICHSIIKSICPTARASSWLAILHKNANICFSGAMDGRPCGFPTGMWPVWITPWRRSSHVFLVIRKWWKWFLNSWARDKYLGIVASK